MRRPIAPPRNPSRRCSVDGCERPHWGHDLCLAHWKRWRRHGTTQPDQPIRASRGYAKATERRPLLPKLGPIDRQPFDVEGARDAAADALFEPPYADGVGNAIGEGDGKGKGRGVRIGSLCTGILGLDRAVAQHFGAEMAWYSEVEPAAISVIEREHPGVPNLGDLTAVDWSQVEPVGILTAGYPCQPFSHAGKRKGKNDARHLWPFIAEAVRHLRPRYVVLENVRGHLSLGFDAVLRSLAEAGFDAEWCVLRASDVGACHQRARLFLVAADANRGGWEGRADEPLGRPEGGAAPRWRGADVPADTDGMARATAIAEPGRSGSLGEQGAQPGAERLRCVARAGVDWGEYGPAVERHAAAFGRPAPSPVDDGGRLAPAFVEWMMGYPEGWVDGLGRTAALKALGNAVVTRQALAALQELCPTSDVILGDVPKVTALLPTPVVNDMGEGKTPERWDQWTKEMKAKHGNGNGHGRSLAIEAQRVASA